MTDHTPPETPLPLVELIAHTLYADVQSRELSPTWEELSDEGRQHYLFMAAAVIRELHLHTTDMSLGAPGTKPFYLVEGYLS